jgi:hypothetical protein
MKTLSLTPAQKASFRWYHAKEAFVSFANDAGYMYLSSGTRRVTHVWNGAALCYSESLRILGVSEGSDFHFRKNGTLSIKSALHAFGIESIVKGWRFPVAQNPIGRMLLIDLSKQPCLSSRRDSCKRKKKR